ncbi:MAG TPA: DUF4230 domain-containing protein, partial [Thermoanaerobaculia bacterium]
MRNTRNALIIAGALVLMLVGLVAVGRWIARAPRAAVESIAEKAVGTKEETIDLSALVTRVRELSRLETASMRVMHVSTARQSRGVIPQALTGDELTFLAVGDVIAGVDLGQLTRDDVWLDPDGTLVLRLPPPRVLVTRLDNNQSRVINRETGILRRRDEHLESRVRARAEASIQREALNKGILKMASDNGEKKLAEFLMTVG